MAEEKNYKFFAHKQCEYFPCHKTSDPEKFNCLFCYCPLYALGPNCGGNFYYTEKGSKSCVNCGIPHSPGGFDYITSKYPMIKELAKKKD